MSTSNHCLITEAFDTIHNEVRRVRAENLSLRAKVSQTQAALELTQKELADAIWQVQKLRGALARKFGVAQDTAQDITAIVSIVA